MDVVDPRPGETVCDPACGTGGFLLSAYDCKRQNTKARDPATDRRMREAGFTGYDIVPDVARLAAMNLYLRGLGTGGANPARSL